jgi:TolB protein
LFILAMKEQGYTRLFAYAPESRALTRLTYGAWDDTTPAISPDGTRLAFASNRSNYWDLYILELATGEVTRVTDSPTYETRPGWSPDGQWLVYQAYLDDNFDILIQPLSDLSQSPIRLTDHPAADTAPVWSPLGRSIAFVSTRSGEKEIWLADFDKSGDERFTNLSANARAAEDFPVWSYDGNLLVWGEQEYASGARGIYIWDTRLPQNPPLRVGDGDMPVWNADGSQLAARVIAPNQTFLAAYTARGLLTLPPVLMPGRIEGYVWSAVALPEPLPAPLQRAASAAPAPLWSPDLSVAEGLTVGRIAIVELQDVQAPQPYLQDTVDEAFSALRQRVIEEINWDALATLDAAFTPLTARPDPAKGEDWLYTGRAFRLNPLLLNAGWLVVVREDFGQQTYWRAYLRTQAQDGSQGAPLPSEPWDINARFSMNPAAYEQGGQLMSAIPSGFWLDLTDLALAYGWERLPATTNWRTYYEGARFAEFAQTGALTWREAMLQLYPPEIFITPTAPVPPTRTPTITPRWLTSPTPSLTPSPRPTFTPAP